MQTARRSYFLPTQIYPTTRKCKQVLPVSSFHAHKEGRYGATTICRACDSESKKERKRRNPEAHRERCKRYREANKSKIREGKRRCYYNKHEEYKHRSLIRKQSKEAYTVEQWRAKCEYHGWRCYLCGVRLSTIHTEHRIPIAKRVLNWLSNLAPACPSCNCSKQDRSEAEYRGSIGLVKLSLPRVPLPQ